MEIAEGKIEYEVLRDEHGNCYPVIKRFEIRVDPEYRNKNIVAILDWNCGDQSGLGFYNEHCVTEIRLDNGEWLTTSQDRVWTMRSNAMYVDGELVPACKTGIGEITLEISKITDKEYIEELERDYGDEIESEPIDTVWGFIDTYLLEDLRELIKRKEEYEKHKAKQEKTLQKQLQ